MKLRLSISLLALLLSHGASAQSDYTVRWGVDGLTQNKIIALVYDLDVGSTHYSMHGSYGFENELFLPSTGSCFPTSEGGAFCNVSINGLNGLLDIGSDLNGTITIVGVNGETIESGSITNKSIN